MHLTTERLDLTDIGPDDVDAVLAVALSNPAFLATHEGSGGQPGGYDRGMLERDLALADRDPGRRPLAVRLRETGEVVGWAELLVEHPRDHVPWIGLLELHADHHRQGFGREATDAFLDWARAHRASALRLGVDDGNGTAMAFWTSLGFLPVERRERDSPAGRLGVTVLEHTLQP